MMLIYFYAAECSIKGIKQYISGLWRENNAELAYKGILEDLKK